MSRVLWKGAISFGLVNIPIELYSAVKQNELDFTLLDRRNHSPVGYQRVNKKTGKEVPWEQIIKGYEYEDGKYVFMSDEDFRLANVEATQTIDIINFVKAEEVSLLYFETPYYLAPGKRGEKGYALLRETLKKAKKIAVANVVIRTKQHLAALVPIGDMLVMNTLRYADELRSMDEFELPESKTKRTNVSDKEIEMALRLVDDMSEKWKPEQYHDTYREDILARIDEKIDAGESEVIAEPRKDDEPRQGAEIVDLMALLKRSVESKKGSKKPAKTTHAHAAKKSSSKKQTTTSRKPTAPVHKQKRASA